MDLQKAVTLAYLSYVNGTAPSFFIALTVEIKSCLIIFQHPLLLHT